MVEFPDGVVADDLTDEDIEILIEETEELLVEEVSEEVSEDDAV